MAKIKLPYEQTGSGEPLVLVHGGFGDLSNWVPLVPQLAEERTVISYSRRGHGAGAPPDTNVIERRRHEDDLAELIEALDAGPVHVVGSSYGASVALGLAARRPELFRSVSGHEPALVGVAPADPLVRRVLAAVDAATELVTRGSVDAGLRHFAENMAHGPGAWAALPEATRQRMRRNALGFIAETRDPHWAEIDLDALAGADIPKQLTQGNRSLGYFGVVTSGLAGSVSELVTILGAHHVPHVTHPEEYAAVLLEFQARSAHQREGALVG
jgi:pimeloyl-ACP methyl ester carboxylesterase